MNDIWVITEYFGNQESIQDALSHGYFASEDEAQAKIDSIYWRAFNPPICISKGTINTPVSLSTPQGLAPEEYVNYPLYSQYVNNEPSVKLLTVLSYMTIPGKESEVLQFICEHSNIPSEYSHYGHGYIPGDLPMSETSWMMIQIAKILTGKNFDRFAEYAQSATNTQFNWNFPYHTNPKKKQNTPQLDYSSYVKSDRTALIASTLVNYEDNLFMQYKGNMWLLEEGAPPLKGIYIIDLIVELLTGENYAQLKADYEKATQ